MPEVDDSLPGLVQSLAGSTVTFIPGIGGVEDAVAALAFESLCERHGVTIGSDDPAAGRATVFGSLAAAAANPGRGGLVLPSRIEGPEAIEPALRGELTLLLAQPAARRLAEVAGVPPERRRPGREMAHHLDLGAFATAGVGEGRLRIGLDAVPPGDGDGVALLFSGADGRWRSAERCRAAVGDLLTLLGRYAEIVTGDDAIAVLAARSGRAVVAPGPDEADAVDASPGEQAVRLRDLAKAARRDAQRAAQAMEASLVEAAGLRERLDAGFAAAVTAAESGAAGRLVPASLHDRCRLDHEAEAAALRRRAEAAEERFAAAEERIVTAEERLSAAEARASSEADAAARARSEARQRGEDVINALEAALAARSEQLLAVQGALGEAHGRLRLAEMRIAQLPDPRAADEGRRAEAQLRRVTSSLSWRMTRPIRVIGRSLRRIAGPRGA